MSQHMHGLSLEDFDVNPLARRVIAKARQEKPWIKKLAWVDDPIKQRCYRVRGRRKQTTSGTPHLVVLTQDIDGQRFGRCDCPAGTPPVDESTGIWRYDAKYCYHLAAAYFHHMSLVFRHERRKAQATQTPAEVLFGAAA